MKAKDEVNLRHLRPAGERAGTGGKPERKKLERPHVPQVEPLIVSLDEAVDRLMGALTGTVSRDVVEDVVDAIWVSNMFVVERCNLSAEPNGATIPQCPNVASVELTQTRGRTLFGGKFRICLPHSRGEIVRAPSKRKPWR